MGSSHSSRRLNDEAIAGDVARFLFLISTMNGRVESFMSARRGEWWTSPAKESGLMYDHARTVSMVGTPVGLSLSGGLAVDTIVEGFNIG